MTPKRYSNNDNRNIPRSINCFAGEVVTRLVRLLFELISIITGKTGTVVASHFRYDFMAKYLQWKLWSKLEAVLLFWQCFII